MRIRAGQKHADPADPDPDPKPWFESFVIPHSFDIPLAYIKQPEKLFGYSLVGVILYNFHFSLVINRDISERKTKAAQCRTL